MVVFNVDMDNTLIYSYKHDIGEDKYCAEIYQEREISFMTHKTGRLLKELAGKILIVPTTTRTREQYERINLGIGKIPYALVCNGGVLIRDGIEDEDWYATSRQMIEDCKEELELGRKLLEEDEDRCFEVRFIKELFLFSKSDQPERTIKRLSEKLNLALVNVFSNGTKVYVVPVKLNKGTALQRFKEWIQADTTIAAGDSEFDVPMLACADIGLAPQTLEMNKKISGELIKIPEKVLFSEGIVEYLYKRV
ncbi:MAG: HAD hydrolase family protein [Lachnospiraceae bacterium]|nr:HAD hydrolase family protein [Lachnospiraceae bacterium]